VHEALLAPRGGSTVRPSSDIQCAATGKRLHSLTEAEGILDIFEALDEEFSEDREFFPTHAHGFVIAGDYDLQYFLLTDLPGAAQFTVSCRTADGKLEPLQSVAQGAFLSPYRQLDAHQAAWEIEDDLFDGVRFVVERPGEPTLEFTLGSGM